MGIIAIIPARGGSKGVPGKNIKLLSGYPLIAYSIVASRLSAKIQRTIVSTDSEMIAEIALKYGAEVPFMRPREFASDTSPDIEFILHAIKWFKDNEGKMPEYMIHLRPTTPLRNTELIDSAISVIKNDCGATSLRSVQELGEAPEKFLRINEGGYLIGLFPNDPRPEYYNLPRQTFPPAYYPNGYVDIIKSEYVVSSSKLHGSQMIGFVTPRTTEVDTPEDFQFLEYELNKSSHFLYDYLKTHFPKEK